MAIWDFRPRGDVLTGVAVGVGVVAAPFVMPLAWSAVRPLAKAILKGGFLLYETGRGAIAEASEWVGHAEPETTRQAKVSKPEESTKAVGHKFRVLERKAEEGEKPTTAESTKKPAHAKPKRQTKTAKKKPEKESQI